MQISHWNIEGSHGEPIYGTTHKSSVEPRGVILMAHGFKGYKDYGMFPWLAAQLSNEGFIVHRFNFSHSGMLDNDGPFERLELFEHATWNTQVEDLKKLEHEFSQPNLPLTLFGHSRGGVATLLAVGRGEVSANRIIALSSPSCCISMSKEDQQKLLDAGRIESPSGRTGQMLHIGKCFLEEQLESPKRHDLLTLSAGITVPCLLIHGENDPTVSVSAAVTLSETIPNSILIRIPGGDHVFNTPNPFPIGGKPSTQLNNVWNSISTWLKQST